MGRKVANTAIIKIFLSLFDLTLENEKENSNELKIYKEDLEVGKVCFKEEDIEIQALTSYGILECKTNYAFATRIKDKESFETIGTMGLFASWQNTFDFQLHLLNGNTFLGNLIFDIKIDNEFGNGIVPHFRLFYQDGERELKVKIQENGYPFYLLEKRGDFKEEIVYNMFGTHSDSYFAHRKYDDFQKEGKTYDYVDIIFISDHDRASDVIITHKEFNNNWLVHHYDIFQKERRFISKAKMFHLMDPSVIKKIKNIINEFSINGESFLEKIILYGTHHYSEEEISVLFGLNKKNSTLEEMYFGKEEDCSLMRTLFPN